MIYKKFKDIELSMLGMGNMRLPMNEDGKTINREEAAKIIDIAMANGINYYDTAYVYQGGDSEKFLGETMPKYPRDSYYLATKYNMMANPDYKAVFAEQLERLQTDRIDFYLLHCFLDNNCEGYLTNGCIEFFEEMQRQGKITYLGFSSHAGTETLEKVASYRKWDFAQIQLNYFDWLYGTAKKEYEILTERNIPVMVMESIRGGRLSNLTPEANKILTDYAPDKSISSWALRFLMSLDGVQVMLSGMSTTDQIKDNLTNFQKNEALTPAETDILFEACRKFRSALVVPCTGCSYCTKGCPMQLDIPQIMKLYNNLKTGTGPVREPLKALGDKGPSACIGCGACTAVCPQGIQIPDIMKDFAAAMK